MIIRVNQDSGAASPSVLKVLTTLDETALYHTSYGLRHPLGIYNMSLNKVVSRITRVLVAIRKLQTDLFWLTPSRNPGAENDLLEATDQMLHALIEHADDCKNILLCFFPSKDNDTYLSITRKYSQNIKEYRDHIGKVVNQLKHHSCRLQSIYFHNQSECHLGYFVEGVLPDGAIGPHPMIHDQGYSAFSYARDLQYHVCGIYFLANALRSAIPRKAITGVTPAVESQINEEPLIAALRGVSALPMYFFEDELKKPAPFVKAVTINPKELTLKHLRIEYPSRHRPRIVPANQARVSFGGDGSSRTFKVPYMGKHAPWS